MTKGAVDKASYDPATGVYLNSPGSAGAEYHKSYHDYTLSAGWGTKVGLNRMEYFFITP